MYCRNCGSEINDGVAFCPNCGQKVIDAAGGQAGGYRNQSQNQNDYSNQSQNQNEYPNQPQSQNGYSYQNVYQEPEKSSPDGFAIASLVLGIISFFIFPLLGAILAIVFGNKSMREHGMNTMAHVGKILGIISLVLWCIIIVLYVLLIMVGIGLML